MVSRFLRRSGIAVGLVCDVLGWKADTIYQIGIGQSHKEIEVLMEEWGPELRVIGCEPHPIIAQQLRNGGYPGDVREVAVSNYIGFADLSYNSRHKDGASLFPHNPAKSGELKTCKVKVTTLDALFPRPEGHKILLWLDCEGSEWGVLAGGMLFVERVEVINIELTPKPSCSGLWSSPLDVHQLLAQYGFYCQWIHTQRISAGQVDAVYVRGHLFKPEYCCCVWEVERYRKDNMVCESKSVT